jgi:signal transduction histidine kinase
LLLLLDPMANLWIVHRDPRWRDALRRLAGSIAVLEGAPGDAARFDAAPPPRAVLLGVSGDCEAELAFAHRHAERLGATPWVLLARERDRAAVERLFDDLPCAVVPLATDATTLRRRLVAALAERSAAALSARGRRVALARRFAKWTGDLDLPVLLAASDPARAQLPVLVRGEPGTGRGLVARYLADATRTSERDRFVVLHGAPDFDPVAALERIARELRSTATGGAVTICVEDLDRVDPASQRVLRDWVESGAPITRAKLRWMATTRPTTLYDDALDPALAHALAGHEIELPPLRERSAGLDAWLAATGREFAPDALAHLRAHPWPDNFRELDAVLRRTLASRASGPIRGDDLRFDRATLDLDPAPPPWSVVPDATIVAETSATPSAAAREAPSDTAAAIQHLSAAIAHEVGNPLVGIRTWTSMLPARFDDDEFRAQFAERVDADTRRIEGVIETLARLGGFAPPRREPVDVSALLAAALERERPRIRERGLVVLEELERARPHVLGDADQLGFAFGLLLGDVLGWIPVRGDLYVATRRIDGAAGPLLRVELRMRGVADGLGFGEQGLAVAVTEAVVRAHGGVLQREYSDGLEAGLRIDLGAADARA